MDRYTVDGIKLVNDYSTDSSVNQEEQLRLLEKVDHALYEQFDQALLDNGTVFQMVLNGVELECCYELSGESFCYTATRRDTDKKESYQFSVDVGGVDDSILADDITEARLVSLWVVAGFRF